MHSNDFDCGDHRRHGQAILHESPVNPWVARCPKLESCWRVILGSLTVPYMVGGDLLPQAYVGLRVQKFPEILIFPEISGNLLIIRPTYVNQLFPSPSLQSEISIFLTNNTSDRSLTLCIMLRKKYLVISTAIRNSSEFEWTL